MGPLRTFAAAALAAGLCWGGATPARAESLCPELTATLPLRIIVPAYFYPFSDTATPEAKNWARLVEAARTASRNGVEFVVIINPGESGVFDAPQSDYRRVVRRLDEAGAKLLGYVFTEFGERGFASIERNVQAYRTHYHEVGGIFLDQVATGRQNYDYNATVKRVVTRAFGSDPLLVGNPGTDTEDPRYAGLYDVLVALEQTGSAFRAYTPPNWVRNGDPAKFAYIVHDSRSYQAGLNAQRALCRIAANMAGGRNGRWWFVTTDLDAPGVEDSPYDTLGLAFPKLLETTCWAKNQAPCE